MIKTVNAKEVVDKFRAKKEIDIMHWAISDVTDTAFLYEAPWRNTWSKEKWLFDNWRLSTGVGYAQMAIHYAWEPHLDAPCQIGYSSHLPTPWLSQELNLDADSAHAGVWCDQKDEIIFREFKGDEGGTVCLLRMDKAEEVIGGECTLLTVFIAERNAWPRGSNSYAAWRRSESICWRNDREVKVSNWSRDTRNNSSE